MLSMYHSNNYNLSQVISPPGFPPTTKPTRVGIFFNIQSLQQHTTAPPKTQIVQASPGRKRQQDQLKAARKKNVLKPTLHPRDEDSFNHPYTNTIMSTFKTQHTLFSPNHKLVLRCKIRGYRAGGKCNACYRSAQHPLRLPPATASIGCHAYKPEGPVS